MSVDQKIVDQHAQWMRENAGGLRLLDITHRLHPNAFANEIVRRKTIEDLGISLAVDAFKRGLGVMALSEPRYRVERFMGAWTGTSRPITPEPSGWLPAPPPADLIDPDALILLKIEAYGFPIGPREV